MRLLILGTGHMANAHALNFAAIEGVELVGGVDVDAARLGSFCAEHKINRSFASFDEALTWGEFDAVANVTPDSHHYATTMRAIAAGKHVFCEKPLATDKDKALQMADAIEAAGLIGMINFTYRNYPAIQKARQMVLAGEIGSVRHVEASHLQSWLVGNAWGDWKTEDRWLWRLSKQHGSNGVLGDIGVHIIDFASYGCGLDVTRVFGRLKTFDKAPGNVIGEYRLDANDSFTMNVSYENGAIGTIQATRSAAGQIDQLRLRIYGEKGTIEVVYDNRDGNRIATLRACLGDDVNTGTYRDIELEMVETNYQKFVQAVRSGKVLEPSFRRGAMIQNILDLAELSSLEGRDQQVE